MPVTALVTVGLMVLLGWTVARLAFDA